MNKLKWYYAPGRPLDGKTNGSCAADDILWMDGKNRIYIRYDVVRGATEANDNQWYIHIQFPGVTIHESVPSLQEGQIICEHYRRIFWEDLRKKITEEIMGV